MEPESEALAEDHDQPDETSAQYQPLSSPPLVRANNESVISNQHLVEEVESGPNIQPADDKPHPSPELQNDESIHW